MARIHRFGSMNEGIEFPLSEAISKGMLCAMFDEPEDQEVYIFFKGDHKVTLSLEESYFLPEKMGKYVVVFEAAEKEDMKKLLFRDISQRLKAPQGGFNNTMENVAKFYLSGTDIDTQMAFPLDSEISKELLCQMFDEEPDKLVDIFFQGDMVISFDHHELNRTYTPEKAGFYRVKFHSNEAMREKEKAAEAWLNSDSSNPSGDKFQGKGDWSNDWSLKDEYGDGSQKNAAGPSTSSSSSDPYGRNTSFGSRPFGTSPFKISQSSGRNSLPGNRKQELTTVEESQKEEGEDEPAGQ